MFVPNAYKDTTILEAEIVQTGATKDVCNVQVQQIVISANNPLL
jgi:hypothetical protein